MNEDANCLISTVVYIFVISIVIGVLVAYMLLGEDFGESTITEFHRNRR